MLWNAEMDGFMLIDFERSQSKTDLAQNLAQLFRNRKERRRFPVEQALNEKAEEITPDLESRVEILFMNEVSSARGEVARFLKQAIIKDE
ncbi:hypothetical protein SS1G_07324 [Sclerotinia sclerotiorum 1980 UF-70]|nr:hypothetical protein SS1G_07324 [Sclerotinia sclerotiorum 1980 UF-70]EDO04841.1 hypothetical protein SS1G_07324 [Sclerotinia sclerotiorum 1980 UF-70]